MIINFKSPNILQNQQLICNLGIENWYLVKRTNHLEHGQLLRLKPHWMIDVDRALRNDIVYEESVVRLYDDE